MKKSLLFASALVLALGACTNEKVDELALNQEITFQVANFQSQTKALSTGQKAYSTSVPFGTYAWYFQDTATPHTAAAQPFMTDQAISFTSPNWKATGKTYYWPKTGSIDFISYSPKATTYKVEVFQDSIKLSGSIHQNDTLMYADKAIARTANVETYQYSGVPTLFHHALAKLNFKVKAETLKKKISATDSTTWEIAIKDITITNLAKTGSIKLNLAADNKTWDLPEDKVWKNTVFTESKSWPVSTENTSKFDEETTFNGQLLTTEAVNYSTAQNYYVLPQTLKVTDATSDPKVEVKDVQNISIKYDIVTKLANGSVIVEKDVTNNCPVALSSLTLKSWQMSKNITYTIIINPAGDLTEIYFDPAVVDMTAASQDININY